MWARNWKAPYHKTMKTQWSISRRPLHITVLLSPVTEAQVSRLFLNLDLQKASLDIANKLIKIAAKSLSKLLAFIHKQSITTGVVPEVFKVSHGYANI